MVSSRESAVDLSVQVEHSDGLVLRLAGELDLQTSTTLAARALGHLGTHPVHRGERVTIDLRPLEFLDSTGLSTLLMLRKRILSAGGTFELVVLDASPVHTLLVMTGVCVALAVRVEAPAA